MSLRGRAAESDLGEVGPGYTPLDLIGQTTIRALEDAGLKKEDVDGLFSASAYYHMPTLSVGEYLGIRPRYSDATNMGGSSFISHLFHAAGAIDAGLCQVALITYGSNQRSSKGRLVSGSETFPYEAPHEPRYPVSMYALAASRHMHEYGTTREQLAEVAVAAREWAKMNPKAFMRDDLTVGDVLSSRVVSSPLSVLDCCLVTDGGGAVIVTRAERARSLHKSPVYLLGAGEAHWHRNISQMPDLTVTAASESGPRAFEMAKLGPRDVDVTMLYDAFTINTVMLLEDLGFCEKGEGGAFVSGGRIAPGGELPVNTNGGGLSYNHPGMYGLLLLVEAVRQIRGEWASASSLMFTLPSSTATVVYSRARSLLSWARKRRCSSGEGGEDMFARVSTFQGPPDQTAEGIRVAREQILPAARLMDGFKGIYLLFDRESGKSLSVTFWETEADMLASEEAASRVRAESAEASGETVVSVERYEVALRELID